MQSTKKWKKTLYENTHFPDNYTDKSFLKDLRINIKEQKLSLKQCITDTLVVVQESCTVVLFVCIFVYLYNEWIDPTLVLTITTLITLIAFIYYRITYKEYTNGTKTTVKQDIRTLFIFLIFGHIFSPILFTLTDTISTDTIYTTTTLMMCIHLIFFDYGVRAAIVSYSLSLCAAMFGSICLASRLASPFHAFVLMIVAVECFVLLPSLRTKFNLRLMPFFCIISATLTILCSISIIVTILLSCILIFINFVCPILYLRWQKFKLNIYGPWDEAVIEDIRNVNEFF